MGLSHRFLKGFSAIQLILSLLIGSLVLTAVIKVTTSVIKKQRQVKVLSEFETLKITLKTVFQQCEYEFLNASGKTLTFDNTAGAKNFTQNINQINHLGSGAKLAKINEKIFSNLEVSKLDITDTGSPVQFETESFGLKYNKYFVSFNLKLTSADQKQPDLDFNPHLAIFTDKTTHKIVCPNKDPELVLPLTIIPAGTEIAPGSSQKFEISKTDDGLIDGKQPFTWKILNEDLTDYSGDSNIEIDLTQGTSAHFITFHAAQSSEGETVIIYAEDSTTPTKRTGTALVKIISGPLRLIPDDGSLAAAGYCFSIGCSNFPSPVKVDGKDAYSCSNPCNARFKAIGGVKPYTFRIDPELKSKIDPQSGFIPSSVDTIQSFKPTPGTDNKADVYILGTTPPGYRPFYYTVPHHDRWRDTPGSQWQSQKKRHIIRINKPDIRLTIQVTDAEGTTVQDVVIATPKYAGTYYGLEQTDSGELIEPTTSTTCKFSQSSPQSAVFDFSSIENVFKDNDTIFGRIGRFTSKNTYSSETYFIWEGQSIGRLRPGARSVIRNTKGDCRYTKRQRMTLKSKRGSAIPLMSYCPAISSLLRMTGSSSTHRSVCLAGAYMICETCVSE